MNLTYETLDLLRSLPAGDRNSLMKAGGISQGTGLVFYDLQVPSEKAIPLITPLRLAIPRRPGRGDTAHRWKAITALDLTTTAEVGEGHRGAAINTVVTPLSAAYAGIGLENPVTWEARYASQNFEDVRATAMQLAVYDLQQKEEWQLIGGMQTVGLGQTTGVVTNTTGAGTVAPATYYIQIVPLTLFGYKNLVLATGIVPQTTSRSNTDGTTDTINMGYGIASNSASVVAAGSTAIGATWASTPDAVAYAVYAGLTGAIHHHHPDHHPPEHHRLDLDQRLQLQQRGPAGMHRQLLQRPAQLRRTVCLQRHVLPGRRGHQLHLRR